MRYPSKVMLLNRLKALELGAVQQKRSPTSGYCVRRTHNASNTCNKSSVVDFNKAFNRAWHQALWSTMRLYNINANLIRVIENLYGDKATNAIFRDYNTRDAFRTTVGVSQGCLVFSCLPSLVSSSRELESLSLVITSLHYNNRIMTAAIDDHKWTVSIGGRTITSLQSMAWKPVDGRPNWYPTTRAALALTSRSMAKKLIEVDSFKCLGAVDTDQGSKHEVLHGPNCTDDNSNIRTKDHLEEQGHLT